MTISSHLVLLALLFIIMVFQAQVFSCHRNEGTFHEEMVRRLQNIGKKWEAATPFVDEALRALEENGYEILQYRIDCPYISPRSKGRFEAGTTLAVTVSDVNKVILNMENIRCYADSDNMNESEAIDRTLINEMFHVIEDSTIDTLSTTGAKEELTLCLDLNQDSPGWLSFVSLLLEELTSQTIEDVIFLSRGRTRALPRMGDLHDHSSVLGKRFDYIIDIIGPASFTTVFKRSLDRWVLDFTEEEGAILRNRANQLLRSDSLREKTEENLRTFQLMR